MIPATVHAQQRDSSQTYRWVSFVPLLAIGPYGPTTAPYDIGIGISYNWRSGRLYQVRQYFAGELFRGRQTLTSAFYIGMGHQSRYHQLVLFAGPALTLSRENLDVRYSATVGASANAQAIFIPVRPIGFGIDLFGNANLLSSLAALRMVVVFDFGKR